MKGHFILCGCTSTSLEIVFGLKVLGGNISLLAQSETTLL